MHLQLEGQPTHNVVAVGAHDVSGLNAVDHGAPLGSAKGDTSLTVTSDYFLLIFNDNRSLSLSDPRKRLGEIKPYLENFNLEMLILIRCEYVESIALLCSHLPLIVLKAHRPKNIPQKFVVIKYTYSFFSPKKL